MSRKEKWDIYGSKPDKVDESSIKKSDVFVVIMTKNWVADPLRIKELEVAKQNHVPVAALVFDNVDEKPYLKDADVVLIKKCPRDNPENCIAEFTREVKSKVSNILGNKNGA